ncbi:BZ3500_MvSof-1268-A1-R1_Chr6-3g08692 [Microbotryum saponariae]|uniref:BZ3500_MvSof-1268-A1-R1_Chr6-3g08692 protein n=1 Tax=Microbotryum saponariae TaxID=289078 RepID=A0A2X0MMC1_9BASI|nr:BZ3500_MvSof-1268-A1-R1_Chr6-3g08692 [Microbotryum saponariae]SDA07293.1 BZ3501_MvSof-1269-A2-R1_Chr6-2g08395 [Microbotryum saponariae]
MLPPQHDLESASSSRTATLVALDGASMDDVSQGTRNPTDDGSHFLSQSSASAPTTASHVSIHSTAQGEEDLNASKTRPRPSTAATSVGQGPPGSDAQFYEGHGTVASPYIVDYGVDDPENPLEWTTLKRWYITGVVSMGTLVVAFGSSVYAGAIPQMIVYFDKTQTLLTLGLTFYVLGFAMGPLLWAPFSELYGRRIVLLPTYTLFTVFHIGCALAQNYETLMVMRFLTGFFGSSPLTNAGGVVSDIWDSKTRALALAWYSLAPFAGPVLGPICGGFLGINEDWRIVFWLCFAFSAVLLGFSCTVPETYTPVLLRRRAARLSKETGDHYISRHDLNIKADETLAHKLRINVSRPFIFLVYEPIVLAMAIYAAIIYATLYLMFPAFPIVFVEKRGWNLGEAGLPFIGVGLGMLLGILFNIVYINPKYIRDIDAAGGHLPPEARLPACCLGGVSLPIGLFWFAWTAQPSVHWVVPCLASIPFGFGMVIVFLSMMSYLVDSYLWLCASALAANAVLRSCLGATFPLFVKGMFDKLGVNWALTLVAFLSLILTPIPFVFLRYGARIRAHSKYAPDHEHASGSTPETIVEDVAEMELQQKEMKAVDERAAHPDAAARNV